MYLQRSTDNYFTHFLMCGNHGKTLPPVFTYFHTLIDINNTGLNAAGWLFLIPHLKKQGKMWTLWNMDDNIVASIPQWGRWRTVCKPFEVYGTLRRDVLLEVTPQSLEPLAGGFSFVLHLPLCLWVPVVWLMFAQQHPVCIPLHFGCQDMRAVSVGCLHSTA